MFVLKAVKLECFSIGKIGETFGNCLLQLALANDRYIAIMPGQSVCRKTGKKIDRRSNHARVYYTLITEWPPILDFLLSFFFLEHLIYLLLRDFLEILYAKKKLPNNFRPLP